MDAHFVINFAVEWTRRCPFASTSVIERCVKAAAARIGQLEARIDVDALMLAVERSEGTLSPEDLAYLRALTGLLSEVREELRSSDASMDRVRRLMCGVRDRTS
jgi:hypothetical protein